MRLALVLLCLVLGAAGPFAAPRAQTSPLPEPGVFAETSDGNVPLKDTFRSVALVGVGGMQSPQALSFPIPSVERVPVVASVVGFLVNIPTVQDNAAAAAQMRFTVGERVREPDFQVMTVLVGKFRVGIYRFSSPQLTHDWLAAAYAKLSNTRKWRGKHPPAIVGLVLNGEMYPVRIDEAVLTGKS
jgi:hypothetical protein